MSFTTSDIHSQIVGWFNIFIWPWLGIKWGESLCESPKMMSDFSVEVILDGFLRTKSKWEPYHTKFRKYSDKLLKDMKVITTEFPKPYHQWGQSIFIMGTGSPLRRGKSNENRNETVRSEVGSQKSQIIGLKVSKQFYGLLGAKSI